MKQGRTLLALGQEIDRQRKARKDFIADTCNLEIETMGTHPVLSLGMENITEKFILNELAHQQIASRLQFRQLMKFIRMKHCKPMIRLSL